MNKSCWILVVAVIAVTLAAFGTSPAAHAESIGYLADTEHFPDMLKTIPDCGEAYQDYLTAVQPFQACDSLGQAKEDLAVQGALYMQLSGMKNCKKCKGQAAEAGEAVDALKGQVKLYASHCPDLKQQPSLMKKLLKVEKEVCSSCHKKWPGKVGPDDHSPCTK